MLKYNLNNYYVQVYAVVFILNAFLSSKQACWQIQSPLEKVQCQTCPAGSFSDTFDADLCRPRTSCKSLRRTVVIPGTAYGDSICGDCLPG